MAPIASDRNDNFVARKPQMNVILHDWKLCAEDVVGKGNCPPKLKLNVT